MTHRQRKIGDIYIKIKEAVIGEGFATEIDWQNDIQFSQITECDLLREAAWVVLSSGMRESIIREKFSAISAAFYCWESAGKVVRYSEQCRVNALAIFHHCKKIDAIITIAKRISAEKFETFKMYIQRDRIDFIQTLPFMGPATAYHLAKNIGLDVVKPDRHLLRVAAYTGYENPKLLCEDISESVGDRVSVVDLVIWRFATLNPNYLEYFARG